MNWGIERGQDGFHITDDRDFSDVALVYERKNAHLLSAAPELLEALQIVLNKQYHSILPSEWDKARAAIKKATGE